MYKILPIVIAPDPKLLIPSRHVNIVTQDIQNLMHDILETLYHHKAIGLAATHVGVALQIIVIHIDKPLFLINPHIINWSEAIVISDEGSVSFPGIIVPINRRQSITIEYLDYDNNQQVQSFDGLHSICIQHEVDQMNGITILNGLSSIKQSMYLKKVRKNILKSN